MEETSLTPPSASHRENGQFAPGNKLGRGNPLAKRQSELRRAFMEAATEIKMQAVEKAIFDAATDGDVAAQRLYLEYTVGKPPTSQGDDDAEQPALVQAPIPLPLTA